MFRRLDEQAMRTLSWLVAYLSLSGSPNTPLDWWAGRQG